MFSALRPSLIYKVNRDIADHDDDVDAVEWSYDGLNVYRGSLDVSFRQYELDVFWLYNDTSECIGLAEHDSSDHSIHKALFYKDNSFSTLFQEVWTQKGVLWSMITSQAYQDFLEKSIDDIVLDSHGRLIIPSMIPTLPSIYECSKCKKSSFSQFNCTDIKKKPYGPILNPIFMDESYIIYDPPAESAVWSILQVDASSMKKPCELVQEYPEQPALQAPVEHDLQQIPRPPLPDEQQLPPPL